MTVTVFQRVQPDTRSPERPSFWHGEAMVEGKTFEAVSRYSPACDIARALVHLGVPDQPLVVVTEGVHGALVYPSLYKAAEIAYAEGASKPLHSVSFERVEAARERLRSKAIARSGVSPKTALKPSPRYNEQSEAF